MTDIKDTLKEKPSKQYLTLQRLLKLHSSSTLEYTRMLSPNPEKTYE